MRCWRLPFVLVGLLVCALTTTASAQLDEGGRRYAEEPTDGVETPAAPLAGEPDALTVVTNPAGLRFLRGNHFGVLWRAAEDDQATTGGEGLGFYDGFSFGGDVVPAMGLGLGVEFLEPPRTALLPDPGEPTRLTIAWAIALGRLGGFGLSWHRFYDDPNQPLDGESTWNLGLSLRVGPRFALGYVARDITRPDIAGIPLQRRHELELAVRPLATDRLELAVGGRLGETRLDADGWLRWSWKVTRGVFFKGEASYVSLNEVTPSPAGAIEDETYELRATTGLELSFGRIGVSGYGSLAVDDGDELSFRGGSVFARVSAERVAPVQGYPQRIERIELHGALNERSFTNLVLQMRRLRKDDDVVAVFFHIDNLGVGWAQAQELRGWMTLLRAAGKKVVAYMVAGSTRDYYVASGADAVFLDPAGGLWLAGFAATTLYFKGIFDNLGVVAEFVKIGEYKSAPEAYTRTDPSEPALRMRDELYDSLYDTIISEIAHSRGIPTGELRRLMNEGPYTAGQLAELPQLVDAVIEPDALDKRLEELLGRRYPVASLPPERPDRWDHDALAVIYIDGDIVTGKSQTIPLIGRALVGGETIAQSIAYARADPRVKAIVLRIDSPGGSALASEIMAREVFETRDVKPIICSLGNIAASGGYFAAAGCDYIYAEPTTITGSIGIFTGKFDVSGLVSRVGLSWHTFKRGQFADRESYFRPYTETERDNVMRQIRYYYNRFLATVARGRDMTETQVDDIGRGRVWTGRQAKAIDLIDEFGGIGDAIALAKQRAGYDDDIPLQVMYLPVIPTNFLSNLLGLPIGKAKATAGAPTGLPAVDALIRALPGSFLYEPRLPQARLPFDIVWE